MLNLTNITPVCIDTKNRYESLNILTRMNSIFKFNKPLYFTNSIKKQNDIEIIDIPDIKGKKDGWSYSYFCLMELPKYIETEFCLVVQHDGFIVNPDMWTNEFLKYDYIGAPWIDNYVNRVGNGGFSLRSKKFLDAGLDIFKNESIMEHEDLLACVYKYQDFIDRGVKFAPVDLAIRFSIEHVVPELREIKSFGFHGTFTEMGRKAIENANNISL